MGKLLWIVVIGVILAYGRNQRITRLMKTEGALDGPEPVRGHTVTSGWVASETHLEPQRDDRGIQRLANRWAEQYDHSVDARRFEVRVHGVVPKGWSFHYTREDDDVEEALDSVVPRALCGADLMDLCPLAFTVSCDADDLVVLSAPMRVSELSMRDHEGALLFGRRLAEALLDRKEEEIVAELCLAAEEQDLESALDALRRHFPEHPRAAATAQACLRSQFAEVRLAAARLGPPEALEALEEIAVTGKNPIDLRVSSVDELSARGERDALLRLATGPADALAGPLLERLSSSADPVTEALALRCLDVPEALSAALTYLGRFGGREVVAPLRGRLTRGGARRIKSDVELCIELVQDRLQGERGGISVHEPAVSGDR